VIYGIEVLSDNGNSPRYYGIRSRNLELVRQLAATIRRTLGARYFVNVTAERVR